MDTIISKITGLWTNLTPTGKFVAVGLAGAAVVIVVWVF